MAPLPPTVVLASGMQPQAPTDLRVQLINAVAASNPGYTANLPGSLIEDIASTDVGAIVLCDSARVETVNSLTPFGSNVFTLIQLGVLYGVSPGVATNTSVSVVFSGPNSYVIAKDFVVSDGTYQYVVQDGGVIGGDGQSLPLSAVATIAGTWAVPANTVTQIATSVPIGITLTVTNPTGGVPGLTSETEWDYRARVLQAGHASATGMATLLKTKLLNVPGTVARLVSVRTGSDGPQIIVGGGDDFLVGYAIWSSLFDTVNLSGSIMFVTSISLANPGVVTTVFNHGQITGNTITINGAQGMTAINGLPFVITVLSPTTFALPIDTTLLPSYTGGGIVTPNFRNVVVSINDYPDTYSIRFIRPPQQTVVCIATWNTPSPDFTGAAAVAQLAAPALADYINSIAVGAPILVYLLEQTFITAVQSVLPPQFVTRLVFTIDIDGTGVGPVPGTGIIEGDTESYFFVAADGITVVQG